MKRMIICMAAVSLAIAVFWSAAVSAKDDISLTYTDGDIVISDTDISDSYKLIGAQYSGGKLIKIKTYDCGAGEKVSVGKDFNDGSVVSFYLWKSLDSVEPACEPVSVIVGSKLSDEEKYAWVMSARTDDDGETEIVSLYTQDNAVRELKISETIEFWEPGGMQPQTYTKEHFTQIFNSLLEEGFLKAGAYRSDTYDVRLVKYEAKDEYITKLYCAADAGSVSDEKALRINTADLYGISPVAGLVSGYIIDNGIIEFNVPKAVSDMAEVRNYSVSTVNASDYVVRQNGSGRHYVVGEFSGVSATVLVNFTDSYDVIADMAEMPSAGNGPLAMVVEDVQNNTSADGYASYTVTGRIDGIQRSVTTNINTNVGQLKNNLWSTTNNGRNFDAPAVWDGSAENNATPLTDYIEKGDIILYMDNGRLIARFSSAKALEAYVTNEDSYTLPLGLYPNRSSSRVGYYFGPLADAFAVTQGVNITIEGNGNSFNAIIPENKKLDLVEISKDGADYKGTITPKELAYYDSESKTGDYVFVSSANSGDLNDVIVCRFTNSSSEPKKVTLGAAEPLKTLLEGEDYGWIVSSDDTEGTVKIVLMKSGTQTLKFADSVDFKAPNSESAESVTDAAARIKKLIDESGFLKVKGSGYEIRLAKVHCDADGDIDKLYLAAENSVGKSDIAIDTTNMNGKVLNMGTVGSYCINDGLDVFIVPNDNAAMNDERNYDRGYINSQYYAVKETGASIDFILGDFVNGIDASVVVHYVMSATEPADFSELQSPYPGPDAMIVTGVDKVESDNGTVYKINGVMNGFDVSVTTNPATNIGIFKKNLWTAANNGRNYDVESVWTAQNGGVEFEENTPADILHEGDIILYNPDGRVVAKLFDAEAYALSLDEGEYTLPYGSLPNKSSARASYYFNTLEDYSVDNVSWIKLSAGDTFVITPETLMNSITISGDGQVSVEKDACSISDLTVYDEALGGDNIYISTDGRGNIKDVAVIHVLRKQK